MSIDYENIKNPKFIMVIIILTIIFFIIFFIWDLILSTQTNMLEDIINR
jgi:hypothetical protein